MEEISATGIVSRIFDQYIIIADDGTEYTLYAILPRESVACDFGSGDFTLHLGKKISAGSEDDNTIWGTMLTEP